MRDIPSSNGKTVSGSGGLLSSPSREVAEETQPRGLTPEAHLSMCLISSARQQGRGPSLSLFSLADGLLSWAVTFSPAGLTQCLAALLVVVVLLLWTHFLSGLQPLLVISVADWRAS